MLNRISACTDQVASVTQTLGDLNNGSKRIRRTAADISGDSSGTEKTVHEYQCCINVLLKNATNLAENIPGVYVLYLNGQVMKCGRAAYGQGVAWRLRQYYGLKYDNPSRAGQYWSVNEENRDMVTVSWQCCPVCKCEELESKLFQKYGKGDWARRAPIYTGSDTWELLI